jgi:hypothetical protein
MRFGSDSVNKASVSRWADVVHVFVVVVLLLAVDAGIVVPLLCETRHDTRGWNEKKPSPQRAVTQHPGPFWWLSESFGIHMELNIVGPLFRSLPRAPCTGSTRSCRRRRRACDTGSTGTGAHAARRRSAGEWCCPCQRRRASRPRHRWGGTPGCTLRPAGGRGGTARSATLTNRGILRGPECKDMCGQECMSHTPCLKQRTTTSPSPSQYVHASSDARASLQSALRSVGTRMTRTNVSHNVSSGPNTPAPAMLHSPVVIVGR